MANLTSQSSSPWQLRGTTASLHTTPLVAQIDLLRPQAGLTQLVYHDVPLAGLVLGVSPGADAAVSKDELCDVFLRGNDLVVTYAETEQRPFTLQVYWRASESDADLLVIDTIVSLQTDLLESFPGVAVETRLAAVRAWHVPNLELKPVPLSVAQGQQCRLPIADSDGLLLQPVQGECSYAEMTHPEDRGGGHVQCSERETYLLHRQLGGTFLEKGVIRRLRVRGVFLPRENDLDLAAHCLASLATEQPPLTV